MANVEYPFAFQDGDPIPRYHLVARPLSSDPTPHLIQEMARLMDWDPYMTSQTLRLKTPRILKSHVNVQTARPEAERLTRLGLEITTVRHADLFEGDSPLRARTLEMASGGLVFRDRAGRVASLERPAVRFIVKGRRSPPPERRFASPPNPYDNFGLGASRLGLNANIKVAGAHPAERIEYFALLFTTGSNPVVEIAQNEIHYDFLGSSMDATALANFNLLTDKLGLAFPGATWDERLSHGALLGNQPTDRHQRLAEIFETPIERLSARLLYLSGPGWQPAGYPPTAVGGAEIPEIR